MMTGWTLLIWSVLLLGFFCYLRSFFPELPGFLPALAVLTLVNLAGIVWVAPANAGLFEVAAVSALSLFGVPAGEALVASVGLHLIVFSSACLAGLVSRWVLHCQGLKIMDIV